MIGNVIENVSNAKIMNPPFSFSLPWTVGVSPSGSIVDVFTQWKTTEIYAMF